MDFANLLPQVELIARHAGTVINNIYQGKNYEQQLKADNTPVTSADYAAHKLVIKELTELTPDIPVLSEEDTDIPFSERKQWPLYWLVDPLDGTQEFIAASDDFATSIALIKNNRPVLGVIYAPVHKLLYSAALGLGATKEQQGQRSPIQIKRQKPSQLTIAVSRVQKKEWVTERFSPDLDLNLIVLGSSTLKSCLVAEGKADCYVRIGPTGEWDTAAAQCILEQAGGKIQDLKLQALTYNQSESLENPNFIAIGDKSVNWKQVLL